MHVNLWDVKSPKLDPLALGLSSDDEKVAIAISEEAETERSRRRSADANPSVGLLGQTDYYSTIPWDELVQSIDVLGQCALRTGLSAAQVLRFAHNKCEPHGPWALFWMAAYLDVLQATTPDPRIYQQATKALDDIAAVERKRLAASGGAGRSAKYEPAKKLVVDDWAKDHEGYRSKKDFAQIYKSRIKNEYDLDVSTKQIVEVWLAGAPDAGPKGT